MRRQRRWAAICVFLSCIVLSLAASGRPNPASLQELIDRAENDAVISLDAGVYYGPIVIHKRVTLEGSGKATIDGRNAGTVITVNATGVRIRGLRIINSGERYDILDAAVTLRDSSRCELIDNRIDNCLFGINLENSRNNLIQGNHISSKPYDLGLRGDGIRLWWSDNNTFISNELVDSRDFVVWYSMGNAIERNIGRNCRYSLHFMWSDLNYVRNNYFENNSVGIYNMYSNGIIMENNTILRSLGATGTGIGLKEASDSIIMNNKILYCTRGIVVDESPFEPETKDYFINNEIVFSNQAVTFVTDGTRVNNIFEGNIFKGNIQDVTVSGTRGVSKGFWKRNYWDQYQGFDRNANGVGDTPYRYYLYADQLWLNNPALEFFRGAVVMTFLEFLQKLAPFSQPELALEDNEPLMKPVKAAWKDEEAVKKELTERIARSTLLLERRGSKGTVPLPAFDAQGSMTPR